MLFGLEVLAGTAFNLKRRLVKLTNKTASLIEVSHRYLDSNLHYNFQDDLYEADSECFTIGYTNLSHS